MIPVICIDPGTEGAGCRRTPQGVEYIRFMRAGRAEVVKWFQQVMWYCPLIHGDSRILRDGVCCRLVQVGIENVHVIGKGKGSKKRGDSAKTAWQFGKACGKMEDRLDAAGITSWDLIDPQSWQREFSLIGMEYDDKTRRQVAIVEELFGIKVTQDAAAAILLAEYFYRKVNGVLESEKRIKDIDRSKRGSGVVGESGKRKR